MIPFSLFKRAMPVMLAGMALFLFSCRPQLGPGPSEKPVEKPELISKAESFEKLGQLDAALNTYQRYLLEEPTGAYAPLAMHRMARIYTQRQAYDQAVESYRRLLGSRPDYPAAAEAAYELSRALYLKRDYQASSEELLRWLARYPDHSLKPQALLLLAEDFRALGNLPQAFLWYLQAEKALPPRTDSAVEVHGKIRSLINSADIPQLETISQYGTSTSYKEPIQYRLATLYFENQKPEKALSIARPLAEQSRDPETAAKAKDLVERIESGRSVQPHVIGCLLPLSGPYSLYGQEVLNGMQLALGMFTPGGTASSLELVIRDSAGNPEEGLAGLEELIHDERVMAVVGPLSSKTASSVAQRAEELQVPIITLTQKDGITDAGQWVFRNMMTPRREVERIVSKSTGELGMRRFAMLYPENAYGRTLADFFWEQVNRYGGEVTAMESYRPDQTDFSEEIQKMAGIDTQPAHAESANAKSHPILNFEAVFLPDNAQTVAMIAPQLVYHDVTGIRLLGTSLWQSPQLIQLAGDYLQGSIFPVGFYSESDRPDVQTFVRDYEGIYKTPPGLLAATGYDTILLLSDLLARRDVRTRDDLRRALLETRDFKGVTGDTGFEPNGDVNKIPFLLTVRGDRAVLLP